MSRGFFTFAQNNREVDYLRLAYGLALSLKQSQPRTNDLSVAVTPDTMIPDKYREVFDHVIEIPWGDESSTIGWKLKNEWKAYHISPYTETIKVAADMLWLGDVEHWWEHLSNLTDFYVCQRAVTHRSDPVTSDAYRKTFTHNDLPNVYSDITWFRKRGEAEDAFALIEEIFKNWEDWFMLTLEGRHRPLICSTDVVYAIALKTLGIEFIPSDFPVMTHLKPDLLDIGDWGFWSEYLRVDFTPACECFIGGYRQTIPLHYQEKDFLTNAMIAHLEKAVGV